MFGISCVLSCKDHYDNTAFQDDGFKIDLQYPKDD